MKYNYNTYYVHAIDLVRTQTVYKCPKSVPKLMTVLVYLLSIATLPRDTMAKVRLVNFPIIPIRAINEY